MNLRAFDSMDTVAGPTRTELAMIRPNLYVRLALETGQRFWARVTTRQQPNGTFRAIADDSVGPVKRGDLIAFEKCHVHEIV